MSRAATAKPFLLKACATCFHYRNEGGSWYCAIASKHADGDVGDGFQYETRCSKWEPVNAIYGRRVDQAQQGDERK